MAEGEAKAKSMGLENDNYKAPIEDVRQIKMAWNQNGTTFNSKLSVSTLKFSVRFDDLKISEEDEGFFWVL